MDGRSAEGARTIQHCRKRESGWERAGVKSNRNSVYKRSSVKPCDAATSITPLGFVTASSRSHRRYRRDDEVSERCTLRPAFTGRVNDPRHRHWAQKKIHLYSVFPAPRIRVAFDWPQRFRFIRLDEDSSLSFTLDRAIFPSVAPK